MIVVNVHFNQSRTSTKSFVDHTLRSDLSKYLRDAPTAFGKGDDDIAYLRSAAVGLSQCISSGHHLTNANLIAYETARAAAIAPSPPAVATEAPALAASDAVVIATHRWQSPSPHHQKIE